jgi:hypothetical protein
VAARDIPIWTATLVLYHVYNAGVSLSLFYPLLNVDARVTSACCAPMLSIARVCFLHSHMFRTGRDIGSCYFLDKCLDSMTRSKGPR